MTGHRALVVALYERALEATRRAEPQEIHDAAGGRMREPSRSGRSWRPRTRPPPTGTRCP
ncbi:hypothetical protein ACFYT4_12725 [Streptomyces sp. NPDC004609]|uniref:hypothetical protein n=1 Tax=Streptomyces sp. NPDC004609 TaxID=3364704 RepID=UPI003692BDDA